MPAKLLTVAFFLIASWHGEGLCAETLRSFSSFGCSYTLPGANWEWVDEARVPNGVFVARDDSGIMLMLLVGAAPSGATVTNQFMVGVEQGILKGGAAKIRAKRTIQFKSQACQQLELDFPTLEKRAVARILIASGLVYQLQLLGTQIPDEPEFSRIMNGFEFTKTSGQSVSSQVTDLADENNNLRAPGEFVGKLLATCFFLGLVVWGIQKIRRKKPPLS